MGDDRALDGSATPEGSPCEADKQEETGEMMGSGCPLKGKILGKMPGI